MRNNKSSRTADMVAIVRAYHQVSSHMPVLTDPYAYTLIPPLAQTVIRHNFLWRTGEILMRPLLSVMATVIGRARYTESILEQLAEKQVVQYVIIGAGMDSYALRNKHANICIFEIDHPATQAEKLRRSTQLKDRPNTEFLAIDFERETISEALSQSNYKPETLSVFCWMGVSYYLSADAIKLLFEDIQTLNQHQQSRFIFDYLRNPEQENLVSRVKRALVKLLTASQQEPMTTTMSPHSIKQLCAAAGLGEQKHIDDNSLNAMFFQQQKPNFRPSKLFSIADIRFDRTINP